MHPVDLLLRQHGEIRAWLALLLPETPSVRLRRERFAHLADVVAIHLTLEERHLFPAVHTRGLEDYLHRAVEEHLGVKRFLADLLERSSDHPQFQPKLQVLRDQLLRHASEEEEVLYRAARNHLRGPRAETLAARMEGLADRMRQRAPRFRVARETAASAPIE